MPFTGTGNPYYTPPSGQPFHTAGGIGAGSIQEPTAQAAMAAPGVSGTAALNDRELMEILLVQHKFAAQTMTNTILESTSPQYRQECINILNRDFTHQRMIWEAMNQRGWYQPPSPQLPQQQQHTAASAQWS